MILMQSKKEQIISLFKQGFDPSEIKKKLEESGAKTTRGYIREVLQEEGLIKPRESTSQEKEQRRGGGAMNEADEAKIQQVVERIMAAQEASREEKARWQALEKTIGETAERMSKLEEALSKRPEGPSLEDISNKLSEKLKDSLTPTIQEEMKRIMDKVSSQEEAITQLRNQGLCKDDESCRWLYGKAEELGLVPKRGEGFAHKTASEMLSCPECGPQIRKEASKDEEIRKGVLGGLKPEEKKGILDSLSDEELESLKERFEQKYEIKPKKEKKISVF